MKGKPQGTRGWWREGVRTKGRREKIGIREELTRRKPQK